MKLISSLVLYVGIMNEVSRKLTKNVYFLSQVQEASHLELTNLSFNYLSSQHLVSKPTTTIFLSQPPTTTHKKKKKKEKEKEKKDKTIPDLQAPNNPFHQESNLSTSNHTTSNLLFISPCLKTPYSSWPSQKENPTH